MKKLLMLVAVAAMVGFASCGNTEEKKECCEGAKETCPTQTEEVAPVVEEAVVVEEVVPAEEVVATEEVVEEVAAEEAVATQE